jgi:hypothetical protein
MRIFSIIGGLFEKEKLKEICAYLDLLDSEIWVLGKPYGSSVKFDDIEPVIEHPKFFDFVESVMPDCLQKVITAVEATTGICDILDYKNETGQTIFCDGSLSRYRVGQGLQRHIDKCAEADCDITAILYLNDDYEGGELSAFGYGSKKMDAGDLVIIDSELEHEAKIIKSGTKYIISWRFGVGRSLKDQ